VTNPHSKSSPLKIVIIGAGLIGVSTAYFLNQRGHHVLVLDRQAGPGRETCFANGSLLTPSVPEPWNTPDSWRVLMRSVGCSDAPLAAAPLSVANASAPGTEVPSQLAAGSVGRSASLRGLQSK
jgi:hypothetical protein